MLSVVNYFRVEEEVTARTAIVKQLRETESQLQEVQEDLETEKAMRSKAEKQKKDLNEAINNKQIIMNKINNK